VIASTIAELMKLRRRAAVWILGALVVVVLIGLYYLLGWWFTGHPPRGAEIPRGPDAKLAYYPASFIRTTLSGGNLGGAICMVLGALAVGSEYGWGTLKTVLTQGPGRLTTFGGRLAALAIVIACYVVVLFTSTAAVSALLAGIDGHATAWPSAADILKGVGSEWLVFATWAAFGVMLAVLFQQSALAIGIGLVYMLLIETLVVSLLAAIGGDTFLEIRKLLPSTGAQSLAQSFGSAGGGLRVGGAATPAALLDANRAVLTLAIYLLAFCAIPAALFRRRDITN
jgi:ABC-2 type transport system permease protein